jgi:DNA invertase Pin-like site-specific DNA recombinase
MIYGYARVSAQGQDCSNQEASLRKAGCSVVRSEKVSGTKLERSKELDLLLKFMRPGDTLMVTRVDRLARSIRDLQNIVHDLKAGGIELKATEQPIDTTAAAGKYFLDMLDVLAELETNLRKERQIEGISKAKIEGKYKGRQKKIDNAEIHKLKEQGLGASEIASKLGIARCSVYRAN